MPVDAALPPDELLVAMGFPEGSRFIEYIKISCADLGCLGEGRTIFAFRAADHPNAVRGMTSDGFLVIHSSWLSKVRDDYPPLMRVGQVPCLDMPGEEHVFFRIERRIA